MQAIDEVVFLHADEVGAMRVFFEIVRRDFAAWSEADPANDKWRTGVEGLDLVLEWLRPDGPEQASMRQCLAIGERIMVALTQQMDKKAAVSKTPIEVMSDSGMCEAHVYVALGNIEMQAFQR